MAKLKKEPNPIDKFVGNRVRMARVMANMSQEKLGDALGLTFQQVQKYEKGTNRIGSSRMAAIAKALEKPVSWFFDEQADTTIERKPGSDIIDRMITTPGGLKLAESYVAIKDNHKRHVVADVAHALAQG